jgi:para-aminobenzoate synthetase component 1
MSQRNTVSYSFPKKELQTIKNKMLNWLKPFSIFSYLDNNEYQHGPNRFEVIAAAGVARILASVDESGADWAFGHIAYDYKNTVEPSLTSRHQEQIGFGNYFFFRPQVVIYIPAGSCQLHIAALEQNADNVLKALLDMPSAIVDEDETVNEITWQYRFDQQDYLRDVQQIRNHIEEGDCYELNFCTEAFARQIKLDPVHTFHKLNGLNPSPFAALYRNETSWLMCASPERFLHREKDTVLSQPIKGTARRGKDAEQDEALKAALLLNPKERAENVMIVDLVRNDLARSSRPGSIAVPELFGVYTFPQVHQLISTVTGTLKENITNETILRHAFPMGSMTGAPKIMVMQLIEQYERSARGLYSGSVGYITPDGDFDFNVVIRSLLYNAATGYLSYQTGGAITYESDPLLEWEEVRLKAKAMEQVFL